MNADVVVIGGGPAGSTVATLLKKYRPDLSVLVLEKSTFPRDHVGESQLPSISPILDEMGVWDRVEAAGFPVKIGASYTWGSRKEQWDFDFYPVEEWQDEPRPAAYQGQRRYTAFQVDRARYDKILLDFAEESGACVRQASEVADVVVENGSIRELRLSSGDTVTGRYYVDASGVHGLLRRALGVQSWVPAELRNIAIWDYWENARWAVEIGVGATRVQVRSLPYGWIWFIPLGPTRTSVGLICPSVYYRECGEKPEALYQRALAEQGEIAALLQDASPEGQLQATKDWSHLAERLVGENWFLCGESAGFADPILAAGMSLAHSSAREVAYSILELERGRYEADWVRERYNAKNRKNIRQHIKFAQYWYAANGCFSDLQDHCVNIAREAGLSLNPQRAWQWLSQGGFTSEQLGLATFGSFDITSARQLLQQFDARSRSAAMKIAGFNVFKLNLRGAVDDIVGWCHEGEIHQAPCYRRGKSTLPRVGYYQTMIQILQQTQQADVILNALQTKIQREIPAAQRNMTMSACIQALEAMAQEGWVECKLKRGKPQLQLEPGPSRNIRSAEVTLAALKGAGREDLVKTPA